MPDDPLWNDAESDDSEIDPAAEASRAVERIDGDPDAIDGHPWVSGPDGDDLDPELNQAEPAAEVVERTDDEAVEDAAETKARRSFWKELPFLIVIALVVAVVIKTFLVQAFFIESGSMRDTLLEGDRVMVNKLSYRFSDVDRGDVVVFDPPGPQPEDHESILHAFFRNIGESIGLTQPSSEFIKRVVALEGEIIEMRDNRVLIDGVPLDERYLRPGAVVADFGPETVPPGHVFVLGDNRNQSRDSRFFGPIPEDDVIGRAFVTVWPPSRWGGL